MMLYRPVGPKELRLLEESGWRAWPPRLLEQLLFYPTLTFDYAEKIARDWNSARPPPDNLGYVTRFEIDRATTARYPVQIAGGREHQELWVPADELARFNKGIVGLIEVVATYKDGARLPG